MTQSSTPEHITPAALYDMSGDDIDAMLERIRERRLSAVRQYEEAMAAAKQASDAKARTSLLKQCDMLAKKITSVNKAIDIMDDRVNKIRALRLELGLD